MNNSFVDEHVAEFKDLKIRVGNYITNKDVDDEVKSLKKVVNWGNRNNEEMDETTSKVVLEPCISKINPSYKRAGGLHDFLKDGYYIETKAYTGRGKVYFDAKIEEFKTAIFNNPKKGYADYNIIYRAIISYSKNPENKTFPQYYSNNYEDMTFILVAIYDKKYKNLLYFNKDAMNMGL